MSKIKTILFALFMFVAASTFGQKKRSFILQSVQASATFDALSNNGDLEKVGQWHNDGLDYVLNGLLAQKIGATDSRYASVSIQLWKDFYATKGIDANGFFNGNFKQFYDEQPTTVCDLSPTMSQAANEIMCKIQSSIQKFTDEQISIDQFSADMNNFMKMSTSLSDVAEATRVGLSASVAKYSFQYWNQNFDSKFAAFSALVTKESSKGGPSENTAFKIRWWAVGLADVWGAWNWGSAGATIGGAHGAVAAGLVGACYQSATSILTQTVISQVSH